MGRYRLSPPVFKHLVKTVMGRSRLSPPVQKHLVKTMVGRSRLSPPVHKHFVKTVVGRSRLSSPVHKQFLKTVVGRSRLSTNASRSARIPGSHAGIPKQKSCNMFGPHEFPGKVMHEFPGKVMQHSRSARIPWKSHATFSVRTSSQEKSRNNRRKSPATNMKI